MTTPIEPISGTAYPSLVVGGKPGKQVFQNPPFDPRILNIAGGNQTVAPPSNAGTVYIGPTANPSPYGTLQRGRLVSGGTIAGGTPGPTFIVNFLYNPSTIYESRSIDLNNAPLPANQRNPDDPSTWQTPLNTTVSFSLLFDRTFELWDKSYKQTIQGLYGCRADVEALYNLTGINQPSVGTPTSTTTPTTGNNTASNPSNYNVTLQGSMISNPVNLYFSPNNKGGLAYFGYLSSMSITWTHFSSAMTPQRCEVDLTLTAYPTTSASYTGPQL